MIRRDSEGYIVDARLDGGDSANRVGLAALFGLPEKLKDFEVSPGVLVRHPSQVPWNNPQNFTRDQLLPFTAGAWRMGLFEMNRRVFWAHFRRGFLAQNFERDAVGSVKKPWPHRFVNDAGKVETSFFDFADPLGLSDIWHLVLAGKIKWLYGFGILGFPALFLSIVGHALLNRSNDEGQIISKAIVGGSFFVWLYKFVKPNWKMALKSYWVDRRDMRELFELITSRLELKGSGA